jgi:DNA replication protein DnaC
VGGASCVSRSNTRLVQVYRGNNYKKSYEKTHGETMSEESRKETSAESKFRGIVEKTQRNLFGERYVGAHISKILGGVQIQEKLLEFMNKKKNFLVYCGSPGIGKTFFCSALVEFALMEFKHFRYWNESELLKRVRSSMSEYANGDYLQCLKYLIDDELVIIDDIGSTGLNEWRKEIIFDAIDERYCSMKPTIFTSNFSRKEFENNFPERVSSRLFAKDNIIIEVNNGTDFRKYDMTQ